MLKYNKALVNSILESGGDIPDDGIEDAFDVLHEFNEKYAQTSLCIVIWI